MKRYIAKQVFRHFRSKRDFLLVCGKTLCSLKEVVGDQVEFSESICNAGLIRTAGGYTCVAKNQRFSFCREMSKGEGRYLESKNLDDGIRALYRIDFDIKWRVKSIKKLRVILDGLTVDPVFFVEDVRLMAYKDSIFAYANGNGGTSGAWPLLGTLEADVIVLRTAVADFATPQKNWMPFECGGCIYLEYSIEPRVILRFDPDSAKCAEAYRTTLGPGSLPSYLHGGAPSLRLNEDFFLGVGNSQHLNWFQDRYYAAVFYLFEAKPPFRVVKVSPPVRVQSRRERIHYICGMAFGEDRRSLVLSIGICDCDNRFVLVSLDQVLALLQAPHASAQLQ